jgi:ABC-type lipoprotein release transport system permease subunit
MDPITSFLDSVVGGFGYFLSAAYHSFFFAVVKFLIGIYVIVVLIDIILLLYQRGLSGNLRETTLGMDMPPELINNKGKQALRKQWSDIRKKIENGDSAQRKIAIIKADDIIDSLIRRMGYKEGENLGERLEKVPAGQIETIAELEAAHETRNRIITEESFELSREDSQNVLKLYEEFLKYHEVL